MDFTEKTVKQTEIFQGRIVRVHVDQVTLPNGKPAEREVCEHPGGVGVLPIDAQGNIILVRQYRYPIGEEVLEMPAGKLDHGPGESHYDCGVRELIEETGCTAQEMIYLGAMYPSPGILSEVTHLYAARGLFQGACCPEEDEFLELVRVPAAEVERRIAAGELRDAKTIAAMYKARLAGLLD